MRRSSSRARTADLDWETFTKKYGAPGKTSLVVPAPLPAEVLFSALKSYCGDGSTRIVIYPSSLAEIALGLARDAPGASSVSRSVNQLRAELRAEFKGVLFFKSVISKDERSRNKMIDK